MDMESPGGVPGPSTSTAAAPRKRSSHPSDTDSEDTVIYSATSDETSDDSDFVPAAKRKAKRRLVRTSPSASKVTVIPTRKSSDYTILFVPVAASDNLNRLNRQATSVALEALVPGEIKDVRINARKNILAIDVTNRSALDVLSNVKVLDNINVRCYKQDEYVSTAGVVYDVDNSISDADLPILIKPATEGIAILQARRIGKSNCVKLTFKGDSLPSHVKVGHFRQVVRPFVPKPLQCRKCQRIGHVSAVCTNTAVCSRCSGSHSSDACRAENQKCANCQGSHDASSKNCPYVKKEIKVLRQMVRDGSSHREAAAKVRRRRSRRRRSSRKSTAIAKDAPRPPTVHKLPQTTSNTSSEDPTQKVSNVIASREEWPPLPRLDQPAERQHVARSPNNDSPSDSSQDDDKQVVTMIRALMNTFRVLLTAIHTPAARGALQILDALNPVLSSLEKHHGCSSALVP